MDFLYPQKLQIGDEIRVIAPSRSLSLYNDTQNQIAVDALTRMGLKVTFSKNCKDLDFIDCGSVVNRVNDIHDAFLDKNVKAIITVIGGYNVNQLLRSIDYSIIKSHPKIIMGYSDITALLAAISEKTGMATYYGPHFTTFSMMKGIEYTQEKFKEILFQSKPIQMSPSAEWADDPWFLDQENRTFYPNNGFEVIQPGEAKGVLFGGHLETFSLLQGTDYFPKLSEGILFIEAVLSKGENLQKLDRYLESFSQTVQFPKLKAVLIGRYAKGSGVNADNLRQLFKKKLYYSDIPIIYGLDFGHTTPHCVVPYGGVAHIIADKKQVNISLLNH